MKRVFTLSCVISNRKTATQLSLYILLFLFLASCKKQKNAAPDNIYSNSFNNGVILNPNLIVVSTDTIRFSLLSVDSAAIIFDAKGPGIQKLKVGAILASGVSNLAPYGFLKMVMAMTISGGKINCAIKQAALTDAIVEGDINITKVYSSADIFKGDTVSNSLHNGQAINSIAIPKILGAVTNTQTFSFSHIFDDDGNLQTTNDQVIVIGNLSLTATLNFQLSISGSSVKNVSADLALDRNISLSAQSTSALKNLQKEFPLGTPIELSPITIYIGILPLVLETRLVFAVGIDGNVTAKIMTSVANTDHTDEGIFYSNGAWRIQSNENHTFSFQPPTLTAVGKLEPYFQIRYELSPYGIQNSSVYSSSIYLGAKAYVDAEATKGISTGLNWSLSWGVLLDGVAQMDLFGKNVLNYTNTIYSNSWIIKTGTLAPTINNLQYSGTLQFGNVNVNANSSLSILLNNNGTTAINVNAVSISAPFSANWNSGTIQPGGSVTIPVTFKPPSPGNYSGTLLINSNAGNSTIAISANGTGIAQGAPVGAPSGGTTSSPTLNVYSPCASTTGNSAGCLTYMDAMIHSRLILIDKVNHLLTFEIERCDGIPFTASGHINVVDNLCGGTSSTSYGFTSFAAGNPTIKITATDNNMIGTKIYHPFIVQGSSGTILYDAPAVTVSY